MFYNFFDNKLNMKPPTLLSLMQSMDNYQHTISELPSELRQSIFDFNYPLSDNINKETFEIQILKHFLLRRIGFETFLAFKINLDNKLNTIMPYYNQVIDNLYFNSGLYSKTETSEEVYSADGTNTNTSTGSTTASGSSTNHNESEVDSRNSDTPQNEIQDIKDGKYISNYTFETNEADGSSSSSESSSSTGTNRQVTEDDSTRNIERLTNISGSELVSITKELVNIYDLIYKDLDVLFYQIIE